MNGGPPGVRRDEIRSNRKRTNDSFSSFGGRESRRTKGVFTYMLV